MSEKTNMTLPEAMEAVLKARAKLNPGDWMDRDSRKEYRAAIKVAKKIARSERLRLNTDTMQLERMDAGQ